MSNKDIEIEIKLPLHNPEEVESFLNKQATMKSSNITQKDTYYIPAHRNFIAKQYPFEWLRVREAGKTAFLTYKHYYPENSKQTDYCNEFETIINSPHTLKKILKFLDFKELVVVEKTRTTWVLDKIEIVIDDVKGLGTYIELEATGHYDHPKQGKKYLYEILKKLNADTGKEDIRGYPYRLLEKNSSTSF